MWIRTSHQLVWVEAEQTEQGLWVPKKEDPLLLKGPSVGKRTTSRTGKYC
jgi:hypothetical protein